MNRYLFKHEICLIGVFIAIENRIYGYRVIIVINNKEEIVNSRNDFPVETFNQNSRICRFVNGMEELHFCGFLVNLDYF